MSIRSPLNMPDGKPNQLTKSSRDLPDRFSINPSDPELLASLKRRAKASGQAGHPTGSWPECRART
jgi:hypothetical protein